MKRYAASPTPVRKRTLRRDVLSWVGYVGLILFLPSSLPSAAPRPIAPPSYVLTDLGSWGRFASSTAISLNERGQVVGFSRIREGRQSEGPITTRATLWDNGKASDLGVIPPPVEIEPIHSHAYGINNRGQIIGSMGGYFPLTHSGLVEAGAFLWERGQLRLLSGRNHWSGFEAFDINERGSVVGIDGYRAFLYHEGRFLTLHPLSRRSGGNGSRANAINEREQVVGATTVPQKGITSGWDEKALSIRVHAFLWQKGKMKDLGTFPPYEHSIATDLNDQGQVVGYAGERSAWTSASVFGRGRAFSWKAGRMTALAPASGDSRAQAINNRGEIVGQMDERAVLWREGRRYDLNGLIPKGSGWILEEARDINNKGQIVGAGRKGGSVELRAFLLTPRL